MTVVSILSLRRRRLCPVIDERRSELHFEKRIASVTQLHDGIGFAAGFVVIMKYLSVNDLRVCAQIAYA